MTVRQRAYQEGYRRFEERGQGAWRNPYQENWPEKGNSDAEIGWREGFQAAEGRAAIREMEEIDHRRRELGIVDDDEM